MLASTLLASLLAAPPVLPSETQPVLVEWRAPASCPGHEEVELRLRALAGVEGMQVWATIETHEGLLEVDLRLADVHGESERSFAARDCELLTRAIVLVVAVAIDPVALAQQLEAASPAPPSPEPASEPSAPEPAPTREEPELESDATSSLYVALPSEPELEPRARVRVATRVLGGGGYGPTRAGYGGIGGSLGVLGKRWRVDLGAAWTIPREVRLDDRVGGRFDAWAITLRGCFVPTLGRAIELPLCPGVEAGQVRARGLDSLAVRHRVDLPWVAPTLAQGLWWAPIEPLALGLELTLLVPLTRGSFVVETFEVDRLARIGVRGLVGIELRLPRAW